MLSNKILRFLINCVFLFLCLKVEILCKKYFFYWITNVSILLVDMYVDSELIRIKIIFFLNTYRNSSHRVWLLDLDQHV